MHKISYRFRFVSGYIFRAGMPDSKYPLGSRSRFDPLVSSGEPGRDEDFVIALQFSRVPEQLGAMPCIGSSQYHLACNA